MVIVDGSHRTAFLEAGSSLHDEVVLVPRSKEGAGSDDEGAGEASDDPSFTLRFAESVNIQGIH